MDWLPAGTGYFSDMFQGLIHADIRAEISLSWIVSTLSIAAEYMTFSAYHKRAFTSFRTLFAGSIFGDPWKLGN